MRALAVNLLRIAPRATTRAPTRLLSAKRDVHAQVMRGLPAATNSISAAGVVRETPLIFDTHRVVVALEGAGFPRVQAAAVAEALVAVSSATQQHASHNGVSKSAFADLRAELSILEKADFAQLKGDIAALEKRVDTAVAELYTSVERAENRVIKWVVAVAGALTFGVLRYTASAPAVPSPRTDDAPRIRPVHT